MASVSYPLPGSGNTVTEAQYEAMMSARAEDGLTDGSPPGTPPVYADSSGMHVKIRPSRNGTLRGFGWSEDSSGETLSIAANASGQTRVDRVVLRLDRSDWSVKPAVVQGTPGAGAPSTTRTIGTTGHFEIPWSLVSIANNASTIAASNLTDTSWYVSSNNTILCTSATRPPESPGRNIWEQDTGAFYTGRGTSGSTWLLTSGSDTGWVSIDVTNGRWDNNAGAQPKVRRINGVVYLRPGELRCVSQLASGGTSAMFAIPAGFRTSLYQGIGSYMDGADHTCDVVLTPDSPASGDPANTVYLRGHNAAVLVGGYIRMKTISYPADA